jgi:hypothetical protein
MSCLSWSFQPVGQFSRVNAEGGGETNDVSQAYVAFTALHAAHVSSMAPSFGRESFLAQSSSLPQSPYAVSKPLQGVIFHRQAI